MAGLLLLVLLLAGGQAVQAQTGGTFDLTWWTVDGGGVTWCTGGTFTLGGTAGQPDAGPYGGGTFVLTQSGFWHNDGSPTAVKLVRFDAIPKRIFISLEWETASEDGNLGFNVYRSAAPDLPGARLNETLIPSASPGGGQGARYTFVDTTAVPGVRFYYTLEDVDVAGRTTRHGPAVAGLWGAYLPVVGK